MDLLSATRSEGVRLIVRAISFRDFQHMWSQITNVTDGQTDGQTDGRTDGRHAIPRPRKCTKVHCAVKNNHRLNVSSSPVLTAIPRFYGSLCDFLSFSSTTDLDVSPSTDFYAWWLDWRGFRHIWAFCSKNLLFYTPLPQTPKLPKFGQYRSGSDNVCSISPVTLGVSRVNTP